MRLGLYKKGLKRRGDRYMLEIIDSKDTRSLKDKRIDSNGRVCFICKCIGTTQWHKNVEYKCHKNVDDDLYKCHKCFCRYDLRSYNRIIESKRKSRNGQFTISDNNGKSLIGEATIAKVRGLDILSIKMNNFIYMFDLSPDPEHGIINAKLKLPYNNNGNWPVNINMEHNYDTLIILCIDVHMQKVVRVYIVPETDVYGKRSLAIVRNPHPSIGSKWEEFRIDEKSCSLYNNAFQSLMSFLRDKKYFGIDDIKKWMEI